MLVMPTKTKVEAKKFDGLIQKVRKELREAILLTGELNDHLNDMVLVNMFLGKGIPLLPPYQKEQLESFVDYQHKGSQFIGFYCDLLQVAAVRNRIFIAEKLMVKGNSIAKVVGTTSSQFHQMIFYYILHELYNFDQLVRVLFKRLSREKNLIDRTQKEMVVILNKDIAKKLKKFFGDLIDKRGGHTHDRSYIPANLIRYRGLELWNMAEEDKVAQKIAMEGIKHFQMELTSNAKQVFQNCNHLLNFIGGELNAILFTQRKRSLRIKSL